MKRFICFLLRVFLFFIIISIFSIFDQRVCGVTGQCGGEIFGGVIGGFFEDIFYKLNLRDFPVNVIIISTGISLVWEIIKSVLIKRNKLSTSI